MNRRTATAGKTRTCPHCRATILESAAICPACRHHLRFDARSQVGQAEPGEVALRIEGSFAAPAAATAAEYSVVVSIRDERGEEVARHVIGVGALSPGEQRSVSLAVELFNRGR